MAEGDGHQACNSRILPLSGDREQDQWFNPTAREVSIGLDKKFVPIKVLWKMSL